MNAHTDLGSHTGTWSASVGSHDAAFLMLTAAEVAQE
jgi:hypothetical protein